MKNTTKTIVFFFCACVSAACCYFFYTNPPTAHSLYYPDYGLAVGVVAIISGMMVVVILGQELRAALFSFAPKTAEPPKEKPDPNTPPGHHVYTPPPHRELTVDEKREQWLRETERGRH